MPNAVLPPSLPAPTHPPKALGMDFSSRVEKDWEAQALGMGSRVPR